MKKKFSCYNRFFFTKNTILLYNAASDGVLVLLPELEEVLRSYIDDIDALEHIHSELFQALLSKRMIVDENENECLSVIEKWKKEDNDSTRFKITINPTMSCNLHCWYCYEGHKSQTKMSEELSESVKKLITNKINDPNLKVLTLDFFGGEPLLFFYEHVLPLLNYAKAKCSENNIALCVSFTTNGVLLTRDVIKELQQFNKDNTMRIQITLDGNRDAHNIIRKTTENIPTYDLIVNNIKEAIAANIGILVRLNYTTKNANTFVDVIKEFNDIDPVKRNLLSFNFHKVWQDKQTDLTEKTIDESRSWFAKEGFLVGYPNEYKKTRCYADKENCIVINYNGELFKCTARDFKSKKAEGVLNGDGVLAWNDSYHKRMDIKYGNLICHDCIIFPICHGGCSQDKLESQDPCACIRQYDDKKKEEILAGRLNYVLKNSVNTLTQN